MSVLRAVFRCCVAIPYHKHTCTHPLHAQRQCIEDPDEVRLEPSRGQRNVVVQLALRRLHHPLPLLVRIHQRMHLRQRTLVRLQVQSPYLYVAAGGVCVRPVVDRYCKVTVQLVCTRRNLDGTATLRRVSMNSITTLCAIQPATERWKRFRDAICPGPSYTRSHLVEDVWPWSIPRTWLCALKVAW